MPNFMSWEGRRAPAEEGGLDRSPKLDAAEDKPRGITFWRRARASRYTGRVGGSALAASGEGEAAPARRDARAPREGRCRIQWRL